jgi:hypothetical protein
MTPVKLPDGIAVRHQGLNVILRVGRGLEFRFTPGQARAMAWHLGNSAEAQGQTAPLGFQVRRDGATVILAASPTLEYQFTEHQARAIAWSLMSEIAVARRTRHLAARGD